MALKLIFMGTPQFAVPILNTIHNSKHEILCVYTQPPKKKNRGQKIYSSPIQQYAERSNLKLRCPSNLNEEEYKYIKTLKPALVIVVAYGKILPKKILDLKNIEFLNIHASLLPKWRGAAPIQRAIMNLDKTSGISIMKIVSKLDAGPTLIKSEIPITNETNFETLSKQMSNLGAIKILEAINLIEDKKANFIDQDESKATYAKKIEKIEGKITWKENADKVIAKINALNPNPGSWFMLKGSRIKVLKAVEVRQQGRPGEILSSKFIIACQKNAIQILELKKEGKNIMKAQEYTNGNKLEVGTLING
tara:strand:- start:281 stop:1201 length:921 start_codon:yes stop_codon:yes gene_type:complete